MFSTLLFKLILLLAFFINNCTSLESENILGDLYAKDGEFDYAISLQVHDIHICGGTLIKNDLVLTAGHCVFDKNGQVHDVLFKVIVETTNLKNVQKWDDVIEIFTRKGFKINDDNSVMNDVAVLKLAKGFNLKTQLKLPNINDYYDGKIGIVAGYGWIDVNYTWNPQKKIYDISGKEDGLLKYVYTRVLHDTDCMKFYKNFICAKSVQEYGKEYRAVCKNDSGGSLVYDDVIIGVLSSGHACDENQGPVIYTKISLHLDFINGIINDKLTSDTIVSKPSASIFTTLKNKIFSFFD